MSAEGNARDHLANERTFLAWIRTALGLIGLGFVLARMGLFLRQLALTTTALEAAGTKTPDVARGFHAGHEFVLSGVGFLIIGMGLAGWSAWLHDRNRRAIDAGRYVPATATVFTVAAVVVVGSLLLIGLVVWRVVEG